MAPLVRTINELQPELLCFFAPEHSREVIEHRIQPSLTHMPRRWDWVVTSDQHDLFASQRALTDHFLPLVDAWRIHPGELVVVLGDATASMVGAVMLAGMDRSSKLIQVVNRSESTSTDDTPTIQGNVWDEAAASGRRDASLFFNRGEYEAAASLFRLCEGRVSGGKKPLYHAFATMAEAYACWHRLQHRLAWDKLKTAVKGLEVAALWGGPPGTAALVTAMKAHVAFLERIVMDPSESKEGLVVDLLANAVRRLQIQHDAEGAMRVLLRGLEQASQYRLFKAHRIKSWDVAADALPARYRMAWENRFRDERDGRLKLPFHAQYQWLEELGDDLGHRFAKQSSALMPLLDAADRAVLGHGNETVKPERVQQLREKVLAIVDIAESALPTFPHLAL
ncbi:MAG: TIGR02710 family CRISPR-associated CARF protein [Nitrospiraceae bacterium]